MGCILLRRTFGLREWDKDVVTELGGVEIDIPHEQWHEVTIEITGDDSDHVVVKQLRQGETAVDTFEADTTIPGGGNIGFGVGDEADFRFDNVGYSTSDVLTATETLRYHYDANSRVVGRTLNPGVGEVSQFFIYDGDRIIQELDENGDLVAAWDYGVYIDELFVMYRDVDDNGSLEPYYYLQDDHYPPAADLRHVIGLTDAAGTVVERYAYDDYGATTIYTGDGTLLMDGGNPANQSAYGNPFLFQGRRWDEVLSLYDYRTRYYDPALGRFLRIDTIGLWGDANNMGNPYAFVGNNPWTNLDPYGEPATRSFFAPSKMVMMEGSFRATLQKGIWSTMGLPVDCSGNSLSLKREPMRFFGSREKTSIWRWGPQAAYP